MKPDIHDLTKALGQLWRRTRAYAEEHPDRLERLLYALFAAGCTLWVANQFFSSLRFQLFLAESREGFIRTGQTWSAPLDDVFIHFDFARSAARGYPFEWSEGNGFSSGGTSLLYPFILALGYRVGYQAEALMLWAGMVATTSVFFTLLLARRCMQRLPAWCAWTLPPLFLATGVLDWSLWSGMEVAFLLLTWAVCLGCWWKLYTAVAGSKLTWPALALGLAGAVMVATRPETATTVACFSFIGLWPHLRTAGLRQLLSALLLTAVPGAFVVLGQAVANRLLTGDFSAAGALVKLEVNHPYLTSEEVLDAWIFHFKYQVLRITNYHFSTLFVPVPGLEATLRTIGEAWPALGKHLPPTGVVGTGWFVWMLAAIALLDRRTRGPSLLLWLSMWSFMAVVALNGQVRWQNERYAMPAVAWLLLNAALGVSVCLVWLLDVSRRIVARSRDVEFALWTRGTILRAGAATAGLVGTALFFIGQHESFDGQRWFFGRASRNIWDQHVRVAKRIKASRRMPNRVLVGDAGAIPYVADVPALDIIGLGGFKDLPFARATRHGVAAGIELVERIPPPERPELMAIYPSWWSDLPLWFGQQLWSVGVRGNVICGGSHKVVYQADWAPLRGSERPFTATRREHIRAELDVADVISERAAGFAIDGAPGFVTMKLLPVPGERHRDLWDAGRILPAGSKTQFRMDTFTPHEPARLVLRVAPVTAAELAVVVGGKEAGRIELTPRESWQEPSLVLPQTLVDEAVEVELWVIEGDPVLYHLWGLQDQ